MKRKILGWTVLLVSVFTVSSIKVNAEGDSELISGVDVSVTREINGVDPASYTSPIMTRSGLQEVKVDIDKWEEEIKKDYLNDNPNFEGDVSIISMEEYEDGKQPEEYKNRKLEELLESEQDNIVQARGAAQTGPNLTHGAIAKAYLFFDNGRGGLIMADGSGFKVSGTKAGTAGHCVYDKEHGFGWVKTATLNFGFRKDPRVGWIASSVYKVNKMTTNNDWIKSKDHTQGIRSDFGSFHISRSSGSVPPNVAMLTTPPNSLKNAVSWGFEAKSRYLTRSTVDVTTSSIRSDWFNWVYQDRLGIMYGGMSGGPLFDGAGRVIGINSSEMNDANRTKVYTKINSSAYNQIIAN
ncbi:hypothetical protein DOK67_0001981 [Enterococcus sp. DIV0212c]|nr:trypsin-like peptidase domain-containing protein [Enterococcus sp. DIV0212c]MBO1355379.1 trypsin-like peptidase domain-containing protein [Enterococcus sp. DIV0212c]